MTKTGPKQDLTIDLRGPRYKLELRLKVFLARSEGRTFTFAQGSDVSEGGMAAYIPAEIEVGEIVGIEATLPYSKQEIALRAQVRNKNGFRYGLEYVLISDEHKEALGKSLKALALMH
jgi:hypothetical protein